jgi:dUTP pyrophosphatase
MKVNVKKTSKNAIIPYKTHNEDFCYDCVAVSEEEVAPNVWKYGLGLAFQIERGMETLSSSISINGGKESVHNRVFDFSRSPIQLSIDARPRSSVWKTGMVLSNCEGTIDELYRGEVSAVFYHLMPNMPRYKVGDRICQIKLGFTLPMEFIEVKELNETSRGEGGYGSTGR